MFNPNYALFMSTEDGCTFQPNPNSSINPDDKRYLRFVGRIVGKAVVDGYLLDAHFTRSLYKVGLFVWLLLIWAPIHILPTYPFPAAHAWSQANVQ